ncbi:MAG: energy-coupling factor transporter transmembrane component T family protein [Syntrophomonadaceae bacterium]|jgi:energy-coupling factor transport system permease protein
MKLYPDRLPMPPGIKGYFPGLSYLDNNSRMHRIHPLVKLVMLISFSLTVFAVPSPTGGMVLLAIMLGAYYWAGMGTSFFFRKLRFILVFGLLILIVQILTVKAGVLIWQYRLGPLSLSIWSQGLSEGLRMMLRFINIVGSSYLFVVTTDPNKLAYALMQAGLPYRFGFMLITALRFIPVLQLELEQVRNAQMAKGIEMEGLRPSQLLRMIRYLLVPLVISVLGKVDNLTISMESRAFGLYPARSFMYAQPWSISDKIILITVPLGFLLIGIIWG